MNNFLDPVDHSLAPKLLRFFNYLIDLVVILICAIIIFVAFELLGNSVVTYFEQNPLMDRVVTTLCYFSFMSAQEIIFKGRSVGKLITGTQVVMENGEIPTVKNYLIRNLCRLIPFDALSFFGTTGWHDSISKTRVVKKKEYEANKLKFLSIEKIGKEDA